MKPLPCDISSRFQRQSAIKSHQRALTNIRNAVRLNNTQPASSRFKSMLQLGPKFQQKQKKLKIEQKNIQMIQRLQQVLSGKRNTAVESCFNSYQHPLQNHSLNNTVRKKEAYRIRSNNLDLVLRLHLQSPTVINKKLQQDYKMSKKYKKQISKTNLITTPPKKMQGIYRKEDVLPAISGEGKSKIFSPKREGFQEQEEWGKNPRKLFYNGDGEKLAVVVEEVQGSVELKTPQVDTQFDLMEDNQWMFLV